MKILRSLVLLALVLTLPAALCACGSGTMMMDANNCPTATTGTLADVKAAVFKPSCAIGTVCHDPTGMQGGLDLVTDPYTALVNAPTNLISAKATYPVRVTPDSLTESFLYKKLTLATESDPTYGLKMPNTGQAVSASQLQQVVCWIQNGAPKQ